MKEKSTRWQRRMPPRQAETVDRTLREMRMEAAPTYQLLGGDPTVARRAGRAAAIGKMVLALLKRLKL